MSLPSSMFIDWKWKGKTFRYGPTEDAFGKPAHKAVWMWNGHYWGIALDRCGIIQKLGSVGIWNESNLDIIVTEAGGARRIP